MGKKLRSGLGPYVRHGIVQEEYKTSRPGKFKERVTFSEVTWLQTSLQTQAHA